LNRMIFECIGEGKNVRECCTRKGVKRWIINDICQKCQNLKKIPQRNFPIEFSPFGSAKNVWHFVMPAVLPIKWMRFKWLSTNNW
jgi:hypothetical protein